MIERYSCFLWQISSWYGTDIILKWSRNGSYNLLITYLKCTYKCQNLPISFMGFFGFFRHKKHFYRDVDFNSDAPHSKASANTCLLFPTFWLLSSRKAEKYEIYLPKESSSRLLMHSLLSLAFVFVAFPPFNAFCWFVGLLQVEKVKHESTGVNNAGICAVIDTMQMNSNAPKDARYMMMWRKVNRKQCDEWWRVSVDSEGYRW